MKRWLTLLLLPLLVLAQENPLLRIDGRNLGDVNPDDVRLLGILARGLAYEAAKAGTYDDTQKALSAAAAAAFDKKDWNRAWRLVTRLTTLLMGGTLDEASEVAAAYDFRLGQRILTFADITNGYADPLYILPKPLEHTYVASFSLRNATAKTEVSVGRNELKEMVAIRVRIHARDLPPGHYFLTFTLATQDGRLLSRAERDFFCVPDLRVRLDNLKPKLEKAKALDLADPGQKAALESAEYIYTLLVRAMKEYVADMNKLTHPLAVMMRGNRLSGSTSDVFKLPQDLDFAESLLNSLSTGKNPLERHTGDMRMAHRSAIDGTLQPFRIFVPQGFSPAKKYPLIVALHGATGDENTYMDRYNTPDGKSLFKGLAQQRGYILVTPNGRGPYGMYVDNSEKDVLEVIDRVTSIYPVNPEQIFLTGHSMGGGGTWQVGFAHPKLFRALAPVASGFGGRMQTITAIPLKESAEMPVLFSYGLKDTLATPEASRKLLEYTTPILKNLTAREYPDDHLMIGVTSMTAIFDFFDTLRK